MIQPSLRDCFLYESLPSTGVLGYFQPSLRDSFRSRSLRDLRFFRGRWLEFLGALYVAHSGDAA